MFFGDHASTSEGIGESLQKYEKTADHTLEASVLLEGLNLEEAGDAESAFTRIGDNFRLPEYWAVRLGVAVRLTEEAIEEGDAAKAAWAMQLAALSRCMLLFLRQLEELAWRGYRTFGVEELQQALEVWESAAPDANESFWQRTLAEHSFVLSQLFSAPTLVIHDQAYVGGKQVDNREGQVTDFLAQNALTGSVALIEIKKPTSALLGRRYRNGVYAASAELVGAIAQAEGNRDTLVKEFYVHARGQADFFPYDPPAVVVIGHTRTLDTEEKRCSFELFRRGLKDIRVATFDETFGQARSLLELIRRTPGGAAANDG